MHTGLFLVSFVILFANTLSQSSDLEQRSFRRLLELTQKEREIIEQMSSVVSLHTSGSKFLASKPALSKYWDLLNEHQFEKLRRCLKDVTVTKRKLISRIAKAFPHTKAALLSHVSTDYAISEEMSDFAISGDAKKKKNFFGNLLKTVAPIAGTILGASGNPALAAVGKGISVLSQSKKINAGTIIQAGAAGLDSYANSPKGNPKLKTISGIANQVASGIAANQAANQVADPNANQEADPNAQAADPNAQAADPNAQTADPNAETADPNAQVADPNAQSADPNAQTADPNAQTADPNAQAAAEEAKRKEEEKQRKEEEKKRKAEEKKRKEEEKRKKKEEKKREKQQRKQEKKEKKKGKKH